MSLSRQLIAVVMTGKNTQPREHT